MNYIKTYTAEEVWEVVVEHAAKDLALEVDGTFKVRMLKDSSIEVIFEPDEKKEDLN